MQLDIKKGKKDRATQSGVIEEKKNNNEPKQNKTKPEYRYANKVQIFTKLYFVLLEEGEMVNF